MRALACICNYTLMLSYSSSLYVLLFLSSALGVAAHEAIHATSGVHQLVLASVERVRGVRDLDFHHGVSLTFKFHGLIGLACGLCKEHIAVGHISEYDGAIVFGVNTFFHCYCY